MPHEANKTVKLLQTKQLELNSLLEITQAINSNIEVDSLFRIYEFILRAQMGVEKLAVFIHQGNGEGFECAHSSNAPEGIEKLDVEGKLGMHKEITKLNGNEAGAVGAFNAIMPVYHKDRPLAYVLMYISHEDPDVYQESIRFVETITNIIIVAIENKRLFNSQLEQEGMRRELELAAQMQSLLIPSELPKNDLYQYGAYYLPNKEVGGDYYDWIRLNKDEHVFCIADISGKGAAAALLMANFQATIRAMIKQEIEAEQFINFLNKNVTNLTKGDKFITMFIAKINEKTREVLYINAGHNPSYMLADGKVQALDSGTTILGMFDRLPFVNVGEMTLPKNAFIVNYTDGLTDLEDESGDRYETDRLEAFIQKHGDEDPERFNELLIAELNEFRGKMPYNDDITLLSCRFA
jgi:sigma-B regulation protein RsbU (phosphoserine phosphatase)